MLDLSFPHEKQARVIVDTDAKNEADDQFAIVHALLTPSFDLHGIIPAHFGPRKFATSLQDSHDEVLLLLRLMGLEGKVRVADGAPGALPDEKTPVPSAGAQLIIQEALRDDPRPLHVAFYSPLTDMASALLLEPRIAERHLRVVWIGGGPYPQGGQEYNLSNDLHATNAAGRPAGPGVAFHQEGWDFWIRSSQRALHQSRHRPPDPQHISHMVAR